MVTKMKNKKFIKPILIILIVQACSYFILKNLIHNYNIIPGSNFELPLCKYFVYIYNSWYPFIFLTAFITYKKDENIYKKLILSLLIGAILSHITFIVYPSMVIRPNIEVNSLTDAFLKLTYTLDTPAVNCLPSVHCLFCFISMFYITKINIKTKNKILINIYLILIVLSTLFTKQHLLIDLILAFIYSLVAIFTTHIFYDKLKRVLKFIF